MQFRVMLVDWRRTGAVYLVMSMSLREDEQILIDAVRDVLHHRTYHEVAVDAESLNHVPQAIPPAVVERHRPIGIGDLVEHGGTGRIYRRTRTGWLPALPEMRLSS